MHIGKVYNSDICCEMSWDSWTECLVINEKEKKDLADSYIGKEPIKHVTEKKYLGDLISSDGKKRNLYKRKDKQGYRNCQQNCF